MGIRERIESKKSFDGFSIDVTWWQDDLDTLMNCKSIETESSPISHFYIHTNIKHTYIYIRYFENQTFPYDWILMI